MKSFAIGGQRHQMVMDSDEPSRLMPTEREVLLFLRRIPPQHCIHRGSISFAKKIEVHQNVI